MYLVSELHALIRDLPLAKVREKLLWCSLELSGTDLVCARLVSNAMERALRGESAYDYLGEELKKVFDIL